MSYLECLFYFIVAIVVIELIIEACKWAGNLCSPTGWEVPSYVY